MNLSIRTAVASMLVLATAAWADQPPQPMRQFYVATHFRRADSKVNTQPQWDVDTLIPQIKALGVTGIRDGTSWSAVEKVKGQYVLPEADKRWVDAVTRAGLKINFLLLYDNKIYDNALDPDAFANYAAFIARTFKNNPNVVALEIWNEPGNFMFRKQYGGEWNGRGEAPWLGKFAELVQKASAAAKRENPNIQVITGAGVAPPMAHLLTRYPQAFANIDGIIEHPYTYRTPPETVPFGGPENLKRDGISVADDNHSMASLLKGERDLAEQKLGRRLPLWVTEFGFGTFIKQKKAALYAGYTEAAQAAYHVRGLVQGLAHDVAVWTIYDLVDDGSDVSDPEHNFGLIRNKGAGPKPAFYALSRVAKLLGPDWKNADDTTGELEVKFDPKVDEKKAFANPDKDAYSISGPQVYWFKVPDGYVTFVWNAGRLNAEHQPPLGTLTFAKPGQVTSAELIDLGSGTTTPLKTTSVELGTAVNNVPVGGEPVAIKWTVK